VTELIMNFIEGIGKVLMLLGAALVWAWLIWLWRHWRRDGD